MGNSPSRNELNGDHMSTIANGSHNSGHETFQSHSYPAKFSSVPGIHNESVACRPLPSCPSSPSQFSAPPAPQSHPPPVSAQQPPHQQQQRAEFGARNGGCHPTNNNGSGGPNTPDLLYSMDSLNVIGMNGGTSITSAELPPSSLSPQRDPWSPASSYSDESLHTQCRNLHGRGHPHCLPGEEEGLSSSTFEGDSLNPLYFQQTKESTLRRREESPSTKAEEVAEEATEFVDVPLLPPGVAGGEISTNGGNPYHSITINGRKVSTCEETALPPNCHSVSSKACPVENGSQRKVSPPPPLVPANGIYSNGTIKRGRMKSPPPPPPPSKANSVGGSSSEPCKMSSLNNLMRRNVSFESSVPRFEEREPSPPAKQEDDEEDEMTTGGAVVTMLPLSSSASSLAGKSGDGEAKAEADKLSTAPDNLNASKETGCSDRRLSSSDPPTDIAIRPCEVVQGEEEDTLAAHNQKNKTELDCKDASGDEKPVSSDEAVAAAEETAAKNEEEAKKEVEAQEEGEAGVDFPEMTETQLDTGRKPAVAMTFQFETELKKRKEAKFGTAKMDEKMKEDEMTVVTTEKKTGEQNGLPGSGRSSKSSSRRGSFSAAAAETAEEKGVGAGVNTGILNCNRISLCTLPDKKEEDQTEVEHNTFDSPSPPVLDSETIQDQPLSWGKEMIITQGDAVKTKGHQRKMSMSKIDFGGNVKSEKRLTTSNSAPSITNPFTEMKTLLNRKASFPELYVNTAIVRPSIQRKLSVGTTPLNNANTNPFLENGEVSLGGKLTQADFLQTLGEIYASKSKMLNSQTAAATAPVASEVKEATPPPLPASLPPTTESPPSNPSIPKVKSEQSSIDTVEGFECQDRSISEYNISPRSAREVLTESLLNGQGSSLASSTVSQVSIVTINDNLSTAPPPPPVPFCQGVETQNPFSDMAQVVIPRLTETSSLTSNGHAPSSATYRKKPGFSRPRVSKGNSLPCVEIYEPPAKKNGSNSNTNPFIAADVEEIPIPPPPPPVMPPLQYCRANSYASSTASSSSMGDSSSGEGQEKSNSPCLEDRRKSNGHGRKVNGSSSECSLVELHAQNQKSTSDAIIVELKKAQAKKFKMVTEVQNELESSEKAKEEEEVPRLLPTKPVAVVQVADAAVVVVPPSSNKPSGNLERVDEVTRREERSNGFGGGYQQTISCGEKSHVVVGDEGGDPPVKAIVNGKHTNSIIVNEVPVVAEELRSSEKKSATSSSSRGGVVARPAKVSLAQQQRGHIMSPSLSGNHTEMNGIDTEAMGASSIHEDELSGQLQQKENHINELHGNLEDGQTTNKLDSASFRRVLSEYEKTLSMFIQQIDQLKQRMEEAETEKQTLIRERDQALEDLRNVESAFSDVHRKYERAKGLLENMKSNEETLIRRDQEMVQRIQNRDKKIEMIKDKAQESIEKLHLDYETRIKEMEFENAKLRAQYRKMEMKLSTLENDVEQKAKENAQLSALCDELINGQVGQV